MTVRTVSTAGSNAAAGDTRIASRSPAFRGNGNGKHAEESDFLHNPLQPRQAVYSKRYILIIDP